MFRPPPAVIAVLACASLAPCQGDPWPAARAVLAEHCVRCHGEEHAKGGLRFASVATFGEGGDRGPVIDAVAPGESRLLHAISYVDPELAMPPDGQLAEADVAALTAWVEAGAPWPEGDHLADPDRFVGEGGVDLKEGAEWWAYRELANPVPPSVEVPWDRHPIDAFVRAGQAARGLEAAPPAEPRQLVRRLTFGLTGLPPTPQEVAAFVRAHEADPATAVRDAVERLLASPHYGEHWARHWLDLVRYADTNGYERDGTKRNMWRYRDWVVRALNDDLSYDRFACAQLAGDEFADHAPELLAEFERDPRLATGYYRLGVWDDEPADPEQANADELADIVDTTSQVFLGTTMGCARCHDHKADPVLQRDYYAMTAYFNGVVGYGGGGFGQHLGGGMTADIADPPAAGQLTAAQRDVRIGAIDEALRPFAATVRDVAGEVASTVLVGDAREAPATWRYLVGEAPERWQTPAFDASTWAEGVAGFGRRGTPGARVGTRWRKDLIHLRTRFALTEIPSALILSFHHDEDIEVYLNGSLVFEREGYRGDYAELQLEPAAVDALVVGSNVLAVRCRQTGGGQYVDAGLRTGWLGTSDHAERLRLIAEADRWLPASEAARVRELWGQRQAVLESPIAEPYPAQIVRERGGEPPVQHVLARGSAHAPGDVVEPAIPAVFAARGVVGPTLPAIDAEAKTSGRRLAFARWMFGPGRFLVARVMANRVWQYHFGRGLCRSSGDFGSLGESPTHPELLDHLAGVLIDRGWSLKELHRYILGSRAYAMSSVGPAGSRGADPRNHRLWRFDPRRLGAEEYRDAVLAVSGVLERRLHGPSVFPPLPQEVLATASRPGAAWGRSSPQDASRRSLYVFVKRSLRMPLLEGLDQPDPDLSCSVRFPTNVPTQALMTLNGAFVHGAAGAMASRLRAERDSRAARIAWGIELAFGRSPESDEIARHEAFVESLQREHGADPDEALRLFCVALFNANEFLWVD